MNEMLYVVTEAQLQPDDTSAFCVIGVYSSQQNASQALLAAIRGTMECFPDESFSQETTDQGLLISSPSAGRLLYNIVVRKLDEVV